MFYDIFSKKEVSSTKIKSKIIADIHEKDSFILVELKSNPEIELEVKSLKIGDYLIGDTILERKTVSDFISSIINRRLIEQLMQMQQYKQRFLIIEGEISSITSKESRINSNAIRGFILSIISNYNTNIIFTKNSLDTSKYLITLAKQQLKNKTPFSLHSKIPKTLKEQKQYILESFPNIGPKKAESLLKKFKSLSDIFNANEEDLKEILKNNSKDFKNILNS
ncbi:MAG: ERCC4 domain-containing protein [Candidatus Pacearchaeota archaeon]|jgi:Fanconi anemia group M protein